MKLKTFTADSIPEAMIEIKQTFGENAVIISSVRCPNHTIRLIAAVEEDSLYADKPDEELRSRRMAYFKNVLASHRVFDSYYERLLNALSRKSSKLSEEKWLVAALEEMYVYKSIAPLKKNDVCIFLGTPGSGKTTAAAKAAFEAKSNHLKVACITLDHQKACGATALVRYTGWMNIVCTYLSDIAKLNETVTVLRLTHDVILIDTPAYNPYNSSDLAQIYEIKKQLSDAEMIYTQPAGLDCQEARTQGALFAKAGGTVLLGTKIDSARSLGGLLETALFGSYQWGGWSKSSKITDYLVEAGSGNLNNIIREMSIKRKED